MQKYAHIFFSRQRQVDLIIGSDLADQLVLEYLKSGTESDDDAGTYRVTCLLIDAVGDFCRMGDRKQVKEAVQFFFPNSWSGVCIPVRYSLPPVGIP